MRPIWFLSVNLYLSILGVSLDCRVTVKWVQIRRGRRLARQLFFVVVKNHRITWFPCCKCQACHLHEHCAHGTSAVQTSSTSPKSLIEFSRAKKKSWRTVKELRPLCVSAFIRIAQESMQCLYQQNYSKILPTIHQSMIQT